MVKSNAAATNVVDLAAFRQRKMMREAGRTNEGTSATTVPSTLVVPVWFCWVPMWTPFIG